MNKAILAPILLAAVLHVGSAFASGILFQGQNAAIFPGANPNSQGLMLESTTRPSNPALSSGQVSPASLIEQSVESQISAAINNQIFNSTAASGSFDLGGGNLINFVRAGGNIVINITDPIHGTTAVTLPDL